MAKNNLEFAKQMTRMYQGDYFEKNSNCSDQTDQNELPLENGLSVQKIGI